MTFNQKSHWKITHTHSKSEVRVRYKGIDPPTPPAAGSGWRTLQLDRRLARMFTPSVKEEKGIWPLLVKSSQVGQTEG